MLATMKTGLRGWGKEGKNIASTIAVGFEGEGANTKRD